MNSVTAVRRFFMIGCVGVGRNVENNHLNYSEAAWCLLFVSSVLRIAQASWLFQEVKPDWRRVYSAASDVVSDLSRCGDHPKDQVVSA